MHSSRTTAYVHIPHRTPHNGLGSVLAESPQPEAPAASVCCLFMFMFMWKTCCSASRLHLQVLPSSAVLQQATINSAQLLGLQLSGAGCLLPGISGDLLVVSGDPLVDVGGTLGDPHRSIRVVIKVRCLDVFLHLVSEMRGACTHCSCVGNLKLLALGCLQLHRLLVIPVCAFSCLLCAAGSCPAYSPCLMLDACSVRPSSSSYPNHLPVHCSYAM